MRRSYRLEELSHAVPPPLSLLAKRCGGRAPRAYPPAADSGALNCRRKHGRIGVNGQWAIQANHRLNTCRVPDEEAIARWAA